MPGSGFDGPLVTAPLEPRVSTPFPPAVWPRSAAAAYGGEVAPVRRTGAVTIGTVRRIPIRSRRDSNQRLNRSTVPGKRAASGRSAAYGIHVGTDLPSVETG